MSFSDQQILFEGDDIQVRAAICPSGRWGLEVDAAPATHPQEPETVAAIRDMLSAFLSATGFE